MAKFFIKAVVCLLPLMYSACQSHIPPRVLVFSKTSPHGYRHQSIEAGKAALRAVCYENGIWADTTENAAAFNEKNLKRYAAVVFLNTNGEVLNPDEEAAFERYIQAGGGFVGVHAASATEYTWKWYGGLVGAYFKDHPAIQQASVQVENCDHPSTRHLGCRQWPWKEEWYNFRHYEPDIEVLLSIHEDSIQGASLPGGSPYTPQRHPLAWRHAYDGGRAFYTALGHIPESYEDPDFRQHLLGGIQYAIGEHPSLDYSRCRTLPRPDQTRFVKTTAVDHLNEPMELDQLPDGRLLIIERHGHLRIFDPATGVLSRVAKLAVYSEMGDGLIGLAVDPEYERTRRLFLYYSSPVDSFNQLSQFVFDHDSLHRSTEKVILRIPVERHNCFHAAGSIAFGPDGLLYLATGDNTSPFASEGFAPIDDRPGRRAFDARRSSANTMDLRGKILRIRVADDGAYTCPSDNLFAKDKSGRPEIFVMGCRNPFRISIDQRRNWLYWGDIGPDAGKTDTARGPMGHDEINQARKAGNFGWPLLVGNNQPYRAFDFEQKKSGPYFDPEQPLNNSAFNTGARVLPPAQSAFIWYPYSRNRDFPMLGEGGRNAMAGPVYYPDAYPASSRFPEYYHDKLIVYDWMRNWLMAVSVDSTGQFYHIEPMADSVQLSRPMDMLIDKKTGALWLLEYGKRWYSSNEEACLSRIDYVRANRRPIAQIAAATNAGGLPFQTQIDWHKSRDNDGDPLVFELWLNGRLLQKSNRPDSLLWRTDSPGLFRMVLKAIDPSGLFDTDTLVLAVGNAPPALRFLTTHNRSFYQPGDTLFYQIEVKDPDERVENRLADYLRTHFEYFDKSVNPQQLPQPAANQSSTYERGRLLIAASDCYNCHAVNATVNGPAFEAVAARYRNNRDFAVATIYRKIIYGGSGAWGQKPMSAHPQIREEDAIEMARWILALGDPPKPIVGLAPFGKIPLSAAKGAYLLKASYRDGGAPGLPALESADFLLLRPKVLQAEKCDARKAGVGDYKPFGNDTTVLQELKHNAWFAFKRADLSGVSGITIRMGSGDTRNRYCGGRLELRLGSPSGNLAGSIPIAQQNESRMVFYEVNIPLGKYSDYHDLYFVFKNEANQGQSIAAVDELRIEMF